MAEAKVESVNQDELILKQQEEIGKEISNTSPLVSEKENLKGLLSEYSSDAVYSEKIEEISKSYPTFRRTRPDGNCFYRAFIYASIENVLGKPSAAQDYRNKIADSRQILTQSGYTQFTIDDFYDAYLDILDRASNGMEANDLYTSMQDQGMADYLVVYLRILTAAELKRNAEFYSNFIEGDQSLEEFCQLEVEPMYKESDHIHITALTSALNMGVKVVYMDRGLGGQHDFPNPETISPNVFLLYRPGHYDVLYKDQ